VGRQGPSGTGRHRRTPTGRRPYPDRAPGGGPDRPGPVQPGGGQGDVRDREHRADPCPAHLPETRRAVAHGTGRPATGHPTTPRTPPDLPGGPRRWRPTADDRPVTPGESWLTHGVSDRGMSLVRGISAPRAAVTVLANWPVVALP